MLHRNLTALFATAALTAGTASAQDIVDTLAADPDFSTLVTAVQTAGLVDALKGPGPLTVFAPTNAAFDKLPADELNALLADPGALTQVLLYHVVGDELLAADVLQGGDATTLANRDVTFSVDNGVPFVNSSTITAVDNVVSNGVIHTIDTVLNPLEAPIDLFDFIRGVPQFSILEAALITTGLDDDLKAPGPLTIFAPTDRAFRKLGFDTIRSLLADPQALSDILLTHVVSGEVLAVDVLAGGTATALSTEELLFNETPFGAYINTSRVTNPDFALQNGILHGIDTVIVPPQPTVVDGLIAFPEFETLVEAVVVAGLDDDLSGDGPFTVFAPLDSAFAALPDGVLAGLLADPAALANVLTYHVVPGELLAADVVSQPGATTLQGQDVTFSVVDGDVFVNGSQVVATDIQLGNGVVHFIDAVLEVPGS